LRSVLVSTIITASSGRRTRLRSARNRTWPLGLCLDIADDTLDDATRERTLALGAAHRAAKRATGGQSPALEDVIRTALEEFALLLDTDTAPAALHDLARRHG
jgi:hypothetical protein